MARKQLQTKGFRGRRPHGQSRRAAQYTVSPASPQMQNLRDLTVFVGFARTEMGETMRSWEAKKMRGPGAQTSRKKLQNNPARTGFLFSGEPAKHWSPNLQTSVDGHSGGVRPERPEMTRSEACSAGYCDSRGQQSQGPRARILSSSRAGRMHWHRNQFALASEA